MWDQSRSNVKNTMSKLSNQCVFPVLFSMFMTLSVWAQIEPCGFFEVDGQPGFNAMDVSYCASFWTQVHGETDFDGDGRTRVLDMVKMINCTNYLGHGLLGTYYGYDEGGNFEITYPDFTNLNDPVVVRATESLNHAVNDWTTFMDSQMNENYAARFEGFLFIPEGGVYDFQLLGYRGMNLYIEGQHVTGFNDGWINPVEGSIALSYGLHPIVVEFFTANHPGSLVLQWRQSGSPVFEVLTQAYLYHETGSVPAFASTDLEGLFFPASGGRTSAEMLDLQAFFMGPDTDIHVTYDGQELALQDGMWDAALLLQPGLNEMSFDLSDGSGRQKTVVYSIYSDRENPASNGLVARLYTEMYNVSPIPEVSGLNPFEQVPVPGCQIGGPYFGGVYIYSGVLCHLEGTIEITQAGNYGFRITDAGSLRINGESICNLNGEYRNQWQPRGSVYLEVGNHHFHLHTGSTWDSPEMLVYWTLDDGAETLIPDSVFHHSSGDFLPAPETDPPAPNGRIRSGLVAEYLLRDGQHLEDSSGNRFTLEDETRLTVLNPGGIALGQGGGLQSEQGGVHSGYRLKTNSATSFEVEFIWEGEIPTDWNGRPVFQIFTSSGSFRGGLLVQNNNLLFLIRDQADWQLDAEVEYDNFLTVHQGQRVHVVGTYSGTTLRLYVNGQLFNTTSGIGTRTAEWDNSLFLGIGNPSTFWHWGEPSVRDTHFNGKIIMAAFYDKELSGAEVVTNYLTNQSLLADPVDPISSNVAFPPTGTTQVQLEEAHHILNRLSYGPTQNSLEDILQSGTSAWIIHQINASGIDDTEMESLLARKNLKQETSWEGFEKEMLLRATFSKKQLNEVLTQFWENHFNTELGKVDYPGEEWRENRAFRQNALGNFKDLLLESGMRYPMNVYLDNIYNIVGAANENYAREIFELHSFGANNGYTQEDIVQAARCFTGWSIYRGKFLFHPGLHDYGEKYIPSLNLTIPAGGGLSDGMSLIDAIVQDSHCAEYISWKLCQLLIDDDPPADVLGVAAAAFTASGGDISQVVAAITAHPRFLVDPNYRRNKVKTPLEFMVSAVRITESYPSFHGMYYYLEKMGMEIFNYPFPTGFEETGSFWVNTNSLLYRWNFIHQLTSNRGSSSAPGMDFSWYINSRGLSTYTEVMDHFEGLTTHGMQEATVFGTIQNYLTQGDPGNFQVTPQTIDQEIRHTLSLFLRLPEFNRQ